MIGINAVHLLLQFTPASFSHDFYDLPFFFSLKCDPIVKSLSLVETIMRTIEREESLDKLSFIIRQKGLDREIKRRKSVLYQEGYEMFINIPLSAPFSIQHVVSMRSRFCFFNRKNAS